MSEWTVDTSMELVRARFLAIEDKIAARDKALELQAEANKIHFEQLNNEAARILKATEITVSRDTWDAFMEGDRKWKADAEKSLNTKSGQTLGIGSSISTIFQIVAALAQIGGFIGVIVLLSK